MAYRSSSIASVKVAATLQQVFGWILTVFFGMVSIVGLFIIEEPTDVGVEIFCLAITAGGVLLILAGSKKKKLISKFYQYSTRLAADPVKSLDMLAFSTGEPLSVVQKNVSKMIDNRFFVGAYIDPQQNRLVFAQTQTPLQAVNPADLVTVLCQGCGATNSVVKGQVGECEFCGSPIQEEE